MLSQWRCCRNCATADIDAMYAEQIVEKGPVADILAHPQPYTHHQDLVLLRAMPSDKRRGCQPLGPAVLRVSRSQLPQSVLAIGKQFHRPAMGGIRYQRIQHRQSRPGAKSHILKSFSAPGGDPGVQMSCLEARRFLPDNRAKIAPICRPHLCPISLPFISHDTIHDRTVSNLWIFRGLTGSRSDNSRSVLCVISDHP